MWAATSATRRARQSQGWSLAITVGPAFASRQSSARNRALSNRNKVPFKNLRNLLKIQAEPISNRNTNAIPAASRLPQTAHLLGGTNHDPQIPNPNTSIHPVESSPGRVLASAFPQGHARNRPGGRRRDARYFAHLEFAGL